VRAVIGLPVEWSDFYVVNALVIVFGKTWRDIISDLRSPSPA
jgi:hypothetical protein